MMNFEHWLCRVIANLQSSYARINPELFVQYLCVADWTNKKRNEIIYYQKSMNKTIGNREDEILLFVCKKFPLFEVRKIDKIKLKYHLSTIACFC